MPEYSVKSPIRHKGQKIREGSVEMTEKEAKPLLALGVLEKAAEKSGGAKKPEDMTVAQLTEALEEMEVQIPDGAKKADLVALYKETSRGGGE